MFWRSFVPCRIYGMTDQQKVRVSLVTCAPRVPTFKTDQ